MGHRKNGGIIYLSTLLRTKPLKVEGGGGGERKLSSRVFLDGLRVASATAAHRCTTFAARAGDRGGGNRGEKPIRIRTRTRRNLELCQECEPRTWGIQGASGDMPPTHRVGFHNYRGEVGDTRLESCGNSGCQAKGVIGLRSLNRKTQ